MAALAQETANKLLDFSQKLDIGLLVSYPDQTEENFLTLHTSGQCGHCHVRLLGHRAEDGRGGVDHPEGAPRRVDEGGYNPGVLNQPTDKVLRPADIGVSHQDQVEGSAKEPV